MTCPSSPTNDNDIGAARRDGLMSWAVAVRAIREIRVRSGSSAPRNEIERRQAESGPMPVHLLDALRHD